MSKNLKIAYILFIIMSAIMVAFGAIASYFGGTGVAFAGLIALLSFIIVLNVVDSLVGKRIKDLLIIASVFVICEFVVYFFVDYVGSWKINSVMFGIQNVISFLSIFFLAYTVFRFILECKNIKVKFVEALLGNSTKQSKEKKKKKELENGSLEAKPATKEHETEETIPSQNNNETEE